jgi:hypothetical protein
MTEQRISRERFLAGAGTGLVSVALPAVARAASSPKVQQVYRLDPAAGVCDGPNGTCACKACYAHTAKIFPSAKAADGNRAHARCNCGVVKAATIPFGKWTALFGEPKHILRYSADLRDRRVQAILKHTALG